MRILQVIGSLNPATGGPAEGAIQQAGELTARGHSVHTASLDSPGAALDSRLASDEVFLLGPSRFRYRFTARLAPWLRNHAERYNVIILHGLWQYHGYCVRRIANSLGVPYVVFLHGMLDPWFKLRYPLKHLKKWLYWCWGEYRVLRDARFVLFTTTEEMSLARQSFGLYKVREKMVGFGIRPRQSPPRSVGEVFLQKYPNLRDKRIILYLSRIHPKKGCDLLIKSFAKVALNDDRLHLVIAGPEDAGWGKCLQDATRQLGITDRVTFTGMVNGELKWGAYDASEVFVLPSHQENFGIVVAEALASELPVLITDKVNIWRDVQSSGAGLVEVDTQAGIDRLLSKWLGISGADRVKLRAQAYQCFRSHFEIGKTTIQLVNALEQAANTPKGEFTYASSRPW